MDEVKEPIEPVHYVFITSLLLLSGTIFGISWQSMMEPLGYEAHWIYILISSNLLILSIVGLVFVLHKDWKRIAIILLFVPLVILSAIFIFVLSFYIIFEFSLITHGLISGLIPTIGNILLVPELKKSFLIQYIFYAATFTTAGILLPFYILQGFEFGI